MTEDRLEEIRRQAAEDYERNRLRLAPGTRVRYLVKLDRDRGYADFLGVGTVIDWSPPRYSQRQVTVRFESCQDGQVRTRSFSYRNLVEA